jgi:hypothetical protein
MAAPSIPETLIEVLRRCRHVCVLTGSGISAESGVPTFREAQAGLWARFDPHELATPEAFQRDPELVWRWYNWRRDLVASAEPNPAHYALAALATLVPRVTLITQNVDGLHQRASFMATCSMTGVPTRNAWKRDPTCPRAPACHVALVVQARSGRESSGSASLSRLRRWIALPRQSPTATSSSPPAHRPWSGPRPAWPKKRNIGAPAWSN